LSAKIVLGITRKKRYFLKSRGVLSIKEGEFMKDKYKHQIIIDEISEAIYQARCKNIYPDEKINDILTEFGSRIRDEYRDKKEFVK